MSQSGQPSEVVGELIRLGNGAYIIRPKLGQKIALTKFAQFKELPNGSFTMDLLEEWIDTDQARDILDVPYTTLYRIMELELVKCYRKTPKRWLISLTSVLDLKHQAQADTDFWADLKSRESRAKLKASNKALGTTPAKAIQTGFNLD